MVRRVVESKVRSSSALQLEIWEYKIYENGILVEVIYTNQRLHRG